MILPILLITTLLLISDLHFPTISKLTHHVLPLVSIAAFASFLLVFWLRSWKSLRFLLCLSTAIILVGEPIRLLFIPYVENSVLNLIGFSLLTVFHFFSAHFPGTKLNEEIRARMSIGTSPFGLFSKLLLSNPWFWFQILLIGVCASCLSSFFPGTETQVPLAAKYHLNHMGIFIVFSASLSVCGREF
ncbi:hypothetical protein HOF92_14495 [bacterium]|jgi:hypothetical protein|nr:hypothetical protein [bacterium]